MVRRRVAARAALGVVLLLATSCSGGDSDDTNTAGSNGSDVPVTSTTAATPTSASTAQPTDGTDSTPDEPPSPTTTPATTTTTPPPEELELGELSVDPLDEHLDDEGVLALDGALALFAATFGPLPDVVPAAEPAPEASGLILSTITPHLHDLLPDQAAAVETVLGEGAVPLDELEELAPPAGVTSFRPLRSPIPSPIRSPLRSPSADRIDEATPILAEAWTYFAGKLGRTLTVLITVVQYPAVDDEGVRRFSATEGARATPLYDPVSLVYDECRIMLNTSTTFEATSFRSQVSHEMFHCFQFALGTERPAWVQEGAAAYAGEEFAGGSDQSSTWWARWVNEPHRPLTARSYDAMGLFALTAELGVDPYGYFDDLLARPVLDTVEVLVGPRLPEVWGLHLANEPGWGADFAIRGPGAPGAGSPRIPLTVSEGGTPAVFSHLPASIREAAQVYELNTAGDIDILSVDAARSTGGMRFSDGTDVRFPASVDVCLLPTGCVCPSGESPASVSAASRTAFVGIGPFPLSHPVLTASSLEEWCEETSPATTTLPPPDPGQCQIGEWVTTSYELPSIPGATTSSGGQGVVVVFGDDGSFVADYGGMTPIVSSAAIEDGPGVSVTVTFTGTLVGTWAADDAGVLRVGGSLGSVHVLATATTAGTEVTIIDSSLAEIIREVGAPFLTISECEGDTMQLTNQFEGFSQVLTLSRTG